jgi:membrane protease YdiL (CAAX protease family)
MTDLAVTDLPVADFAATGPSVTRAPAAIPGATAPPMVFDAAPEATARPQRWKFWGTTLWAVAILVTFVVVGGLWMFGLVVWSRPDPELAPDDFLTLRHAQLALEIAGFVVAGACAFSVLALAIRLTGVGMRAYLGLIPARARDVGLGFAGLLVIYLVFWLVFYLAGNAPSRYAVDLYRAARTDGTLPLLLLGTVIAAPLCEELLIRGFLYRGWAASRLGPSGAIVLTSAVWAVLHTQYDWLILAEIFCIGLLYGEVRRRGGSTTATMMLHATQNAWSFAYFELLDRLGLISG